MALLEAKNVSKIFGGLTAVDSLDFVLEEGQMCSIIGPNGAGKTTFFNTLTGIYKCEKGTIQFCGKSASQTDGRSLVGRQGMSDGETAAGSFTSSPPR